MSSKPETQPIAFGRAEWRALSGLPLTVLTELVRLKLIRSFKIGRRRLFLHSDAQKFFNDLANRGGHLVTRKRIDRDRARRAAARSAR